MVTALLLTLIRVSTTHMRRSRLSVVHLTLALAAPDVRPLKPKGSIDALAWAPALLGNDSIPYHRLFDFKVETSRRSVFEQSTST